MSQASLWKQNFVLCHHDLSANARKIATFMHDNRNKIGIEHLVEYLDRAISEASEGGESESVDAEEEELLEVLDRVVVEKLPPLPKINIGKEKSWEKLAATLDRLRSECLISAGLIQAEFEINETQTKKTKKNRKGEK